MTPLLFVDVETTSLERPSSPTPGEVWEVAAVRREEDGVEFDGIWHLPVTLEHADPVSLDIGRFHERHRPPDGLGLPLAAARFVTEFEHLARGAHWVGNVPSFDEERIAALFHRHSNVTGRFPWHYHLIDTEALIAGYLRGLRRAIEPSHGFLAPDYRADVDFVAGLASPPWDSEALSRAVGVDPGDFDRHTAMGDVRWAMAMYDAIRGAHALPGVGGQDMTPTRPTAIDVPDEVLAECLRYFASTDEANAAVHFSPVRYSPIAFRIAQVLNRVTDGVLLGAEDVNRLSRVLSHAGAYPEDRGRVEADPGGGEVPA